MIHRLLSTFVRWLARLLGIEPAEPRRTPVRTPWNDTSDPSIGWTYHVYDAAGALLYVGSSKHHPFARLADHATKPWWPSASAIQVTMFKWANYHESHVAEIAAIQQLTPVHNKVRYVSSQGLSPTPAPVLSYDFYLVRTYAKDPQ